MPGSYAVPRRDSNTRGFPLSTFRSYSHAPFVIPIQQTMFSERSKRFHAIKFVNALRLRSVCKTYVLTNPAPPQQSLHQITSPWPFHKWGIDIAGPFPVAAGGLKFLIVAIDYFTKWIEAKAVATITGNQRFASVKHPQTNGLVERANRSLGEGIKARLDRHKGRWVEELSHVLWAHRTTIKVSTGDTPFSLVYGTEAVIPAEIGMPTIRTAEVNLTTNDDERRIDLDILEERREQAAIRDFVYRANDASHAEDTGKLGPKWEGPYEVTEALGKGAYKLRDMDGRELPRTWNICNLKKSIH
ncbi:reverse transcriptase domain-containing protein [Tanacetum coccineum]